MRKKFCFVFFCIFVVGCSTPHNVEQGARKLVQKGYANGPVSQQTLQQKPLYDFELKDGKMDGLVKVYDEDGQLFAERTYHRGMLQGPYKYYYADGTLYVRGMAVKGVKHGKEVIYFPEGQIMDEMFYSRDQLAGERRFYYPDGTLLGQAKYIDGLLMGYREYYETGRLYVDLQMEYGTFHSVTKYNRDGRIEDSTMTFLKGLESVLFPPAVMTKVMRFIQRQEGPQRHKMVSDYAHKQLLKGMRQE